MEVITEKVLNDQISELVENIDDRAILLQGRAGTGKTITLLRLGYRLAIERGSRVLVLTYNRALVSDIRRTLTLTGLGDDVAEKRLEIDTVHNLMHSLAKAIGIDVEENSFLENYDEYKDEALKLLSEAGTEEDYVDLVDSTLPWDYILIDEGQDWPQNELDLLLKVRGHRGLVIADGVNQLIRQPRPADWAAAIPRRDRMLLPLERCLRMKANLARFVTSLGDLLGQRLRWSPEEGIPGGRVVILEGSYIEQSDLHSKLTGQVINDGQKALDMLFCVPPNLVKESTDGNRESLLGSTFKSWGLEVWDGVSSDIRRTYPISVDQFRIVQYDSCRGLEGWTTVNIGLDEFYDYKMAEFQLIAENQRSGHLNETLTGETVERSQAYAARWLMIPLTRAIDTLVITLEQPDSLIRDALLEIREKHADFITWYP